MSTIGSVLFRSLKTYQVYGANTGVGKTVVSTVLCKALGQKNPGERVWYLKPVSTGPLSEADDNHLSRFAPNTNTTCLYQFDEPVSPHIAAADNKNQTQITDISILQKVDSHITKCSQTGPGTLILETAGGIHSPTPTGSSQADLYRPLRLPVLLIADHHLGGISSSISAFESLHIRGYDLSSVLLFSNQKYKNHEYLDQYFSKRGISVLSFPTPPERDEDENRDFEQMSLYYENICRLEKVEILLDSLTKNHESRIEKLESLSRRANEQIWYPFTQHQGLSSKDIMTIDSACGDFFQTYSSSTIGTPKDISTAAAKDSQSILNSTLDGSASWWTQGLGHGNPSLALSTAYAAGRYGHVMFAGAIHEPALSLSTLLLQNMNNPRLSRVFYSDNGSTGVEVAVKMALSATSQRYKYDDDIVIKEEEEGRKKLEIGVIGLKGSYHGDTIGAMDCSEPSVYSGKVHWYEGRGYWFDFPRVKMKDGEWIVESPVGFEGVFGSSTMTFSSLNDVFDMARRDDSISAEKYRAYILETLRRVVEVEGKSFGALMMEPVILGAGGMLLVDPLFQRCLVQVVRENPQIFDNKSSGTSRQTTSESNLDSSSTNPSWTGLPVIFDEVFTGLYRLGRFNSASFLGVHPDISVHAKLLTGGLLPLSVTLASNSIYEAFLGTEKSDALLHGHSYTAHAVGCEVARSSVETMLEMEEKKEWDVFKNDWCGKRSEGVASEPEKVVQSSEEVWSMWSHRFLDQVSRCQSVESVIGLGSVLAINLHDDVSGYNSNAALGLREKVMATHDGFGIHARVLGNVFYLMMSQTTKVETVRSIEAILMDSLS